MSKEVNKEDGSQLPPSSSKTVSIYSTDMAELEREWIIQVAQKAFNAPVNHGKTYQTIADVIRAECEKSGDRPKGGAESSGGWCCVVGDAYGSSVTHLIKTYLHFSVVSGVNVLVWRSG